MKKIKPPSDFPANFIAEGLDQTRGWFYTLHILANALFDGKFPAFKNVITNGIVLAEDGQKMSKSKKNYPPPEKIFEKYGADAMRFYLLASPVVAAQDLKFSEKGVAEILKSVFLPLKNSYKFFAELANLEIEKDAKFVDIFTENFANFSKKKLFQLDRWILAELRETLEIITLNLENYHLDVAARQIPKFLENLTNFYIRLSRRRFWQKENSPEKISAFFTLYHILNITCQMIAPFSPFLVEKIWRSLNKKIKSSIHLTNWPDFSELPADKKLVEKIAFLRKIIFLGNAARATEKIGTRQPLQKMKIVAPQKISTEYFEILKSELNLKEIEIIKNYDHIARQIFKINARKVGKKFGPKVQKLIIAGKNGIGEILSNGNLKIEYDKKKYEILKKDEFEIQFLPAENLKNWVIQSNDGILIAIDTQISNQLKIEFFAREIIRNLQNLRKKAGLQIGDRVKILIFGAEDILQQWESRIAKEVLASKIFRKKTGKIMAEENLEIDNKDITLGILYE